MYWLIGDTVATKQGSAKITAISIEKKEATLQLPDGTVFQYPYVQQEKIKVSSHIRKYYHAKPTKEKKPKLTPEEKELRKQERILAKAKAKLAAIKQA